MRIVFMGTPDFAVPSLQRLMDAGHTIAAVYTQPDKPKGRGQKLQAPPVKQLAQTYNIPVLQPLTFKDPEAVETLRGFQPELIVVAAYGKLLPVSVLQIPPRGCINVHGSLLPKYRGAAPIQWAVLNGEKTAGVTIMQMAQGLDTGDMLSVRETAVGEEETSGELFDRLMVMGADLLVDTIERLDEITPVPQQDALSTYAPMIKKEMAAMDFTKPAQELHNLVRGMNPWPVAYFSLLEKRMKVFRVRPVPLQGVPGVLENIDGEMTVYCGKDALQLVELQPENGKRMLGKEYLRGHPLTEKVQLI